MKSLKVVLVAKNDEDRRKGLMFRDPIKEDECAIFKFDNPGQHCFWNKNVDFPISILFCSAGGKVEDIKILESQQIKSVSPDSFNIINVIEAHKNAPEKYGIKKGSYIKIFRPGISKKHMVIIEYD